jgi:hypothetical protein
MADQHNVALLSVDGAFGERHIVSQRVRGFCTATTLRPLACRSGMTLLQDKPSAKAPCTRTTVGVAHRAAAGGPSRLLAVRVRVAAARTSAEVFIKIPYGLRDRQSADRRTGGRLRPAP